MDTQTADTKSFSFSKISDLKFGENPQQKAALYSDLKTLDYNLLSGEALSYNNILDAACALEISAEFFDVASCVIVKHANPVAAALAGDIEGAWDKSIDSDPLAPFGSVVCFTKKVELPLAKKLRSLDIAVVIAPDFAQDAIDVIKKDKNIKIIKVNTPYQEIFNYGTQEIKITPFGALIQEKDTQELDVKTFKVVTSKKPEQKEAEDMIFAFKVAKHVKSCGVVAAKDLRTLGICAGQADSVSSIEVALNRVCDSPKGAIIASDSPLCSIDSVLIAVQNRISAIIQPAGSEHDDDIDKEIVRACNKYEISMISTGIRHFRH